MPESTTAHDASSYHVRSDKPFYAILAAIGGIYVFLIVAILAADVAYMSRGTQKRRRQPSGRTNTRDWPRW